MCLDCQRIDQNFGRWPAGRGESMENIRPNALRRPSNETVIERLVRATDLRRVNPPASLLQNMHDPADHPPIINFWLAARIRRQKRHQTGKLFFR